ncbi:hypothetical protein L1887_14841 [Cichorium endivia]|nr:hypothetical protein L1887_14841 [Cichorium endivia]
MGELILSKKGHNSSTSGARRKLLLDESDDELDDFERSTDFVPNFHDPCYENEDDMDRDDSNGDENEVDVMRSLGKDVIQDRDQEDDDIDMMDEGLYGKGVTKTLLKKVNGVDTSEAGKRQIAVMRKELEDDHERKKAEMRKELEEEHQRQKAEMRKELEEEHQRQKAEMRKELDEEHLRKKAD